MKNTQKIQGYFDLSGTVLFIALSTAVLFLSTSYSQAGFISETAAPPAAFLAKQIVAPHFAGRNLAYEARPIVATGAPGSLLGQGNAAQPSAVNTGMVEGFADQIPLSIAMQQVLPQGYVYALGDGVNAGQLVSWRGGRQWQSVMNDMLASSGLGYSVNGQVVTVSNMGGAPAVVGGAPHMAIQTTPSQPYAQQATALPAAPMMPDSMPPLMPDNAPPMMPGYGAPPMGYGGAMMMPDGSMMMDGSIMIDGSQIVSYAPQSWEARPGQTLRKLLQEWCARAGTELNWQAEYDYPIMASFNMAGTFEEAVRMLLSGFHGAKPVPYGRLHYNPAIGQSILIVQATGNHYGD